jgi:hypothetical protein
MMAVIDGCQADMLGVRLARKLKVINLIDALSDLFR